MGKEFQIAGLGLVGLGAVLILLGGYMTMHDWSKKLVGKTGAEKNSLGGALQGLAKLANALKDYPTGQQLIVWGIALTIVGGLMGGVGGLK